MFDFDTTRFFVLAAAVWIGMFVLILFCAARFIVNNAPPVAG